MTIDLDQPQIMAAVVGGGVAAIVSLIVAVINQLSLRSMHRQKLETDRDLAERKVNADIALAQKKFALDQELATWKRRSDLAEQALVNFYEARNVFDWVRSRGIFGGEGQTREADPNESPQVRDQRNTYFVPIERLMQEKQVFAALQTLRPAFEAHFGSEALEPFQQIAKVHAEITAAATTLIAITTHLEQAERYNGDIPLRNTLGWGPRARPDQIDDKINQAVQDIEIMCQPILAWKPGT